FSLSVICKHCFFLLNRSVLICSLHPFPTRRSSDLAVHLVEIPSAEEIHDNIVAFWVPDQPLKAGENRTLSYRLHATLAPALTDRSEEHTSELQSREKLVCRLLLEKKKKS